jgi:hypothetical protein
VLKPLKDLRSWGETLFRATDPRVVADVEIIGGRMEWSVDRIDIKVKARYCGCEYMGKQRELRRQSAFI